MSAPTHTQPPSKHPVSVHTAQAQEWRLSQAVLIYTSTGYNVGPYATVHEVHPPGRTEVRGRGHSTPTLGAGVPATKDACAALVRALGVHSQLTGFTPPHLLYIGRRAALWWRPPAPAIMHFNCTRSAAGDQSRDAAGAALLGKCAGRSAQPGLVFGIQGHRWWVWAVRGAERPGPTTKLYQAPYFNVYDSGQICIGTTPLPTTLGVDSLVEYERAFFGSAFTHPNTRRLVKGCPYRLWRTMLGAGQIGADDAFPEKTLLPLKTTLREAARTIEGDRDD